MLTYGALCELAQRHGVTITEKVRAFVREIEQTDAAQTATDPIAWESTTFGHRKYLTQAQYERIGERFRKWYKPYRCSACASHEASAPGLCDEGLDTSLLWYLNHELGRALSEAKSPNLSRLHVTTLMELVNRALTRASAATASPDARIEELRKGLFEARDAMRVMSNWVKQSDPAGHSWGVRMVDRANAVLSGASAATVAEPSPFKRYKAIEDAGRQAAEETVKLHEYLAQTSGENAAQQQAEPSIPSGWRGRLQEMRDASYTYSQYPELAQAVFDSVIDALGELEVARLPKPPEQTSEADDKPTEQQTEPNDPTGLIARLRIHAEDRANTAFARSSMREAVGVLEDQQHEASTHERSQQLGVFLRLAEVVQADAKRTRDRYPAQSERADQLAAFMKTACKWAAQQLSATDGYAIVPVKPTENMHAAAVRTIIQCHGNDDFPPRVWAAMIAAASQQEATK